MSDDAKAQFNRVIGQSERICPKCKELRVIGNEYRECEFCDPDGATGPADDNAANGIMWRHFPGANEMDQKHAEGAILEGYTAGRTSILQEIQSPDEGLIEAVGDAIHTKCGETRCRKDSHHAEARAALLAAATHLQRGTRG